MNTKSDPEKCQYWQGFAEYYQNVGTPYRPSIEDTKILEQIARDYSQYQKPKNNRWQALLCGSTPAIAEANWPTPTDLVALDSSREMLDYLWPGDAQTSWGSRIAKEGNWLEADKLQQSFDFICGDGVLNLFSFPNGIQTLAKSFTKIAHENSLLIMRTFLRSESSESSETVMADFNNKRIETPSLFRFRLTRSLQQHLEQGISRSAVLDYFERQSISRTFLEETLGWKAAEVSAMFFSNKTDITLFFPDLADIEQAFKPHFSLKETIYPSNGREENCPTIVLERLNA